MNQESRIFCRFATVVLNHFPAALPPLAILAIGFFLTGCQDQSYFNPPKMSETTAAQVGNSATRPVDSLNLREGDVLKVIFPSSPTLDSTQVIRRDGKINLPLIGDVDAAGMTPSELEKKLVELYAPQLASKQITVQVQTSSFPFYVTGMVLKPGKISTDHPITALEAVMEAGGFDYAKADLKHVTVIRREGNVMKNYRLDLKAVLDGSKTDPFYLKPDDIVYVPERFNFF